MPPQLSSMSSLSKVVKYILIIILALSIASLLILLNNFLAIREIQVVTSTNESVIDGIDNLKKKNILLLSIEKSEKLLIRQNPKIKQIEIKKIYPSKLLVTIFVYEPLALLEVDSGYFALGEDGRILYKKKDFDKNLPLIHYYQKFAFTTGVPGEIVSYKDITLALHLLNASRDLALRVDSIDIAGLSMIAFNLANKKILFTTQKDETLQEYELETIIKRFKLVGHDFKNLDLRFDKPVISY